MKIDILTLFPDMFKGPFNESIVKRAREKGVVRINIHNLRSWATDKHKTVDDRPYGGGKGMIMKVDVIDRALRQLKFQAPISKLQTNSKSKSPNPKQRVILLTPKGKTYKQAVAIKLSKLNHIILICGHYEGFDERVRKLVDMEISIGGYVLTGGELPAMVITDSIVRLLPGVLSPEATKYESFSWPSEASTKKSSSPNNLTVSQSNSLVYDFPQYTRPENYKGMKVPKILLSGNFKKIEEWRNKHRKKA